MENYRRLFKEAERIKPGESMWKNIAAAVTRHPSASRAPGASQDALDRETPLPEARPWRLAASLAVGLGTVAALAVLFREPPSIASRGGAEDTAIHQVATADAGEAFLAEGLQEWHADLGVPSVERFEEASAEGWADESMLLDPLLEE